MYLYPWGPFNIHQNIVHMGVFLATLNTDTMRPQSGPATLCSDYCICCNRYAHNFFCLKLKMFGFTRQPEHAF